MQKSTEVMKMMSKLCKVGEISNAMQAMQQEMLKAVIEEMVDDAMEALDENDEGAADYEVGAHYD